MRRDAFVQNDSGGFSIMSGDAVDDIIEDARSDDERFVRAHQALLLELVGDDSLPVRIVVDEPLNADEEREWLARIRWQLDVKDGRVVVAGGFDPDVLQDWRDERGPDDDGVGVAVVAVPNGLWNLDVYTFASSMNGNALLEGGPLPIGAWFRRDHAGVPFPLWLARILDYGDDDPGYESLWRDAPSAFAEGTLPIDIETRGFIGLLFHLHHRDSTQPIDEFPEGGWFASETGAREVEKCPLGIRAEVEDRDLVSLMQRLTRTRPEPSGDIVWGPRFDVRAAWQERPAGLAGGPVAIGLSRAWLAWAIPMLCSDGVPGVEARISNAGNWQPVVRSPLLAEFANGEHVLGFPNNMTGWPLGSVVSDLSEALAGLPDGARLELFTGHQNVDDDNPDVGALRLTGKVHGGRWLIASVSPTNTAAHLSDALDFNTNLFEQQRLITHTDAERSALEIAYAEWSDVLGEDCIRREGDVCTFDPELDFRGLVLLAQPVFRTRFAGLWAMDGADDMEDDE